MPLTDLTPEEHQWIEDVYKALGIHAGGGEGAGDGEASDDVTADFSQLMETISDLESKSDILRNSKAHNSAYKKVDKATQSTLHAALEATKAKDQKAMASTISALHKWISEHSDLISDGEHTLQELEHEIEVVRGELAVLEDRREDFVRSSYFSKAGVKKLDKFNLICESAGVDLNNASSCVRQRKIDDLRMLLKAANKNLQRIRKEIEKLDQAAASKPKAKPVSGEKLQDSITADYEKKRKSWRPQVCYNAAMKVGVMEGGISEFMRTSLMGEAKVNGYPEGYPKLMGVTPETVEKQFDHTMVDESGILNFVDDVTGKIAHTAYVQKTDKGSVELYHTNSPTLDMALLAKDQDVPKSGLVTHYDISDPDTQSRFQGWLDGGYSFKLTRASELK